MDWVELGQKFGVPLLVLAALGWFTAQEIWPFIKTEVWPLIRDRFKLSDVLLEKSEAERIRDREESEKERQIARQAFFDALDRRDDKLGAALGEVSTSLKAHDATLIQAIEALTAKTGQEKVDQK